MLGVSKVQPIQVSKAILIAAESSPYLVSCILIGKRKRFPSVFCINRSRYYYACSALLCDIIRGSGSHIANYAWPSLAWAPVRSVAVSEQVLRSF